MQDEVTGAKTLLYRVEVDRGVSWDEANSLLNDTRQGVDPSEQQPASPQLDQATQTSPSGFYRCDAACCMQWSTCCHHPPAVLATLSSRTVCTPTQAAMP